MTRVHRLYKAGLSELYNTITVSTLYHQNTNQINIQKMYLEGLNGGKIH